LALLLLLLLALLLLLIALLLLLLLFLLTFLTFAKDGFVLGAAEVNWKVTELGLEVVSPLSSALERESLLGGQVDASELDVPGLDLNGLVAFEEVLVHGLVGGLGRADLDPLSADANLVGLSLDQVDRDGGVGQSVEAVEDVHQGSHDLLLLDAHLALALVLFAVFAGNAGALVGFRVGTLLVEHVGVGEEAVLLHQALARGLEVGGVLAVQIATETTGAALDQLRSNNLDADAIGDDL
jgi:hypothetical protein